MIRLSEVDDVTGLDIQKRMHYIHSERNDTLLHLGLLLDGFDHPLCYAAFSRLDRRYLFDALAHAGVTEELPQPEVAVMTRAFGYNPLPKNAMSKLFEKSAGVLRDSGFHFVITALNPFLGFKGSVFSGSSFIPFATSPMKYWYNGDGMYHNRRTAGQNPIAQKYSTPPIVWMVRALDRRNQRRLESSLRTVVDIGARSYAKG